MYLVVSADTAAYFLKKADYICNQTDLVRQTKEIICFRNHLRRFCMQENYNKNKSSLTLQLCTKTDVFV